MLADIFKQVALFCVGLFLMFLGLVSVLLPWSHKVSYTVETFLREGGATLFILGIAFLAFGATLIGYLLKASRQSRYYIKTGDYSVCVDERVLDEYLKTYWTERYPDFTIDSKIEIRDDKRLHIGLKLPAIDAPKQRPFVESLEYELKDLLVNVCGYRKPFHITATFYE